jgi:hypothetical protein
VLRSGIATMSWNRSSSPIQFSSRFSNWSYQDISKSVKLFGAKSKIDSVKEVREDDELPLTSSKTPTITAKHWSKQKKIVHLAVSRRF